MNIYEATGLSRIKRAHTQPTCSCELRVAILARCFVRASVERYATRSTLWLYCVRNGIVASTAYLLNQVFECAANPWYGETEQRDTTEEDKFFLLAKDAISKDGINRPLD
jgi:hypothetical protein